MVKVTWSGKEPESMKYPVESDMVETKGLFSLSTSKVCMAAYSTGNL